MLKIDIVSCLNDNYSYVLYDDDSKLVAVLDPSEFKPIDSFISKKYKKIDYILNTHHHFDHVNGNDELKKKYNSQIMGPLLEKEKIPGIDTALNGGDIFKFGNITFKILFLPGHTSGHISFYSKEEKVIFTGDTLFSLGCGRVFEGTVSQMYSSIKKIKKLPVDTKIYCGHEYTKNNYDFCATYEKKNKLLLKKLSWINKRLDKKLPTIPTTLDEELKTNIFLRCDNLLLKKELGMNNSSEELIFEKLRNLKDNF
jgi:hydroxyacylglutathione hydrolase